MAEQDPNPNSPVPGLAPVGNGRRWRLMAGASAFFFVAALAYGVYWMKALRNAESTDNAYVGGNVVQITPQVAGTVVGIDADDTQFVRQGQVLVQLDRADAEVALQQAEGRLAKTVRDVRSLFASDAGQQANVDVRRTELARAEADLARRERLSASGAVSGEEVQHAREAVSSARSALASTEQQLAGTRALVEHTTVQKHPDVQIAAAAVKDAYLAYARTSLPAPVSGFVAKRNVQLGQRVGAGTALMAVVPLAQVWVDANFKEAQLANIREGQPAILSADLYGSRVRYHGRVAGFGAGTGAAFALLPAQNATGNWIKIVQRIPVRIELDAAELAEHPLQLGLSMQVRIDTHDRGAPRMPQVAQAAPSYTTGVFDAADRQAEARVREIILSNTAGRGAPAITRFPMPRSTVAEEGLARFDQGGRADTPRIF